MGKTAGEIYCDMEEHENNLTVETLNRMYFDKIINPYRKSKKIIDMHTLLYYLKDVFLLISNYSCI